MPLLRVAVPSSVDPLKNWTVPVGVPAPGLDAATVAASVTDRPKTDGAGAAVSVASAPAWLPLCASAGEPLEVKLVSPRYVPVIELAPVGSEEPDRVAVPLVKVAVPSDVVPLKNSTVPVGVPAPGLTADTVA